MVIKSLFRDLEREGILRRFPQSFLASEKSSIHQKGKDLLAECGN
ncbi:hypothetical protein LEP1GSC199_3693 [Leptospira vanthielii serovar Holland str. Waz Holland = ATCC 700522]|uniref:Uncharacterized protein n=1 Tax=Leptospira vanthielii serovar Holland str. Waz Holland = ATCC 700522 TaxID=1218591 RepID=N1WHR4_9LEPT|nr:hypothetical protein LEP1GSC199_3693 [Leptospira vanthielii serovar Holland str. Waz Holland = ATCC 700522]